ncbi:MAG: squalene/phytoene synthase family protein [Verrucomicrobiota bacterium]
MADQSEQAEEITKKSKSNLAFAFASLPKKTREDMVRFYAFCRVVDDIVDNLEASPEEKRRGLDHWRRGLDSGFDRPTSLESDILTLRERYQIPTDHFHLIIDGMEMDIAPPRYETFEELKRYCYHVASAVGLISIEIFGYRDPGCRDYAERLGYALQWTNIVRDVGQDWTELERIYLPREDLDRFDLSESDFAHPERKAAAFRDLLRFEGQRALTFHEEAAALLPPVDRRSMVAFEIMRNTYRAILDEMRSDEYQVFQKRYKPSRPRMVWILTRTWLSGLLPRR